MKTFNNASTVFGIQNAESFSTLAWVSLWAFETALLALAVAGWFYFWDRRSESPESFGAIASVMGVNLGLYLWLAMSILVSVPTAWAIFSMAIWVCMAGIVRNVVRFSPMTQRGVK